MSLAAGKNEAAMQDGESSARGLALVMRLGPSRRLCSDSSDQCLD